MSKKLITNNDIKSRVLESYKQVIKYQRRKISRLSNSLIDSTYCLSSSNIFPLRLSITVVLKLSSFIHTTGKFAAIASITVNPWVSLLDAVTLSNAKELSTAQIVKKNIDELTGDSLYEKFYPVTGNKVNNLKLYGKDIIQNLFKNNKQELSTLVNHIESERLVLDKIRYM